MSFQLKYERFVNHPTEKGNLKKMTAVVIAPVENIRDRMNGECIHIKADEQSCCRACGVSITGTNAVVIPVWTDSYPYWEDHPDRCVFGYTEE